MAQHYFSRPYRGTHYRLYYLGSFNGPSPVFTVTGCQLSRPDGTEIDEPARLKGRSRRRSTSAPSAPAAQCASTTD